MEFGPGLEGVVEGAMPTVEGAAPCVGVAGGEAHEAAPARSWGGDAVADAFVVDSATVERGVPGEHGAFVQQGRQSGPQLWPAWCAVDHLVGDAVDGGGLGGDRGAGV